MINCFHISRATEHEGVTTAYSTVGAESWCGRQVTSKVKSGLSVCVLSGLFWWEKIVFALYVTVTVKLVYKLFAIYDCPILFPPGLPRCFYTCLQTYNTDVTFVSRLLTIIEDQHPNLPTCFLRLLNTCLQTNFSHRLNTRPLTFHANCPILFASIVQWCVSCARFVPSREAAGYRYRIIMAFCVHKARV